MPIYEYKCDYCNNKFEYLVLSNIEPKKCQYCSKNMIRRVMSTCSFYSSSSGNNNSGNSSSSSCGSCSSSNCSGCK